MASREVDYGPRPTRRFAPGEPTPGTPPIIPTPPTPAPQAPQPQEFVQPFSYQTPGYQGYNLFNRGRNAQPYQVPDAPQFYAPAFQLPTQEDVFADPSYQFRLNQGLEAIERSAAARGMLRSGNTLQGLQDYAQNYASQEYQSAVDRARMQHELNYQTTRDMYAPGLLTWQARNQAGMSAWDLANQLRQQEEQRRWQEYVFGLDDEFRREQLLYQGGLGTF